MKHLTAMLRALTRQQVPTHWTRARWQPRRRCSSGETGGFEMTFLGTSSQGGACRYPSSLAMRLRGSTSSEVWIFDAGEGCIAQLQRSYMRVGSVCNVFVTHVHGDHLYGLPGLVLSVLARRHAEPGPPLRVFGPPGVRSFLRMALGVAGSAIPLKNALQINEIKLPLESARRRRGSPYWLGRVRALPFEISPRDIEPDVNEAGHVTFSLLGHGVGGGRYSGDGTPASVVAAPVKHTVPCLAYSVSENVIEKRFDKNRLLGLGIPSSSDARSGTLFRTWLKGEPAVWEGREIKPEEVLEDGRKPRRVCVVGDTHDASPAAHIAQDVDVLVHEATNMAAQTHIARKRGHSSTRDATAFAKKVGAKRLLLNHTSVAYSEPKLRALESEARALFGLDSVYVARDLSVFNVPTEHEDEDGFVFRRFVGFTSAADCWRQKGLVPNANGELVSDEELTPFVPEIITEGRAPPERYKRSALDDALDSKEEDSTMKKIAAEELGLKLPPTAAASMVRNGAPLEVAPRQANSEAML